MKEIRKKIYPRYFKDVCSGDKIFELRKDEDNIQTGDILILEEYNPDIGYTGRKFIASVLYVLRNISEYGLMDGYCIIIF